MVRQRTDCLPGLLRMTLFYGLDGSEWDDKFSLEDLSQWCYERTDLGAMIGMDVGCHSGVVDLP